VVNRGKANGVALIKSKRSATFMGLSIQMMLMPVDGTDHGTPGCGRAATWLAAILSLWRLPKLERT
jgi:hypothetical protein